MGDLDKAIEYLQTFLKVCQEVGEKKKQSEAHKQLAETYQK